MKLTTLILIVCLLLVAGVAVTTAMSDGPDNGMGEQERSQDQLQNQTQAQEQLENRTQTQNRTQEQLEEQQRIQEQERLQTQARNVTELHEQLQERKQELEQERVQLSPVQQRVYARYSNVSAFVHVLLNESQTRALLGEGPNGIGPQVSAYAREFNNSLRAQIQAEERIENKNALIRIFTGGDEQAAGILEQETIRNQERIQQMQQLLIQCQECDPQVREMLQDQLQEMEQEQTRLQQLAQREKQDKGLFGWLWK